MQSNALYQELDAITGGLPAFPITTPARYRSGSMGKRVRKSTQIRLARKDTAQRKRAALEFQAPRRQGKPGKGLSA